MCDQIPVELCKQLTLEQLMSLELLQCQRRNFEERSTVLTFLNDTMKGNNPIAKPGDRMKAAKELMRLGLGSPPGSDPRKPKFTSKDLLRLGYGCDHAAD